MPTYHFRCPQCQKEIEMKLPFGSAERPACPDCKTPTEKYIVPPAIQFKGTGFYKTDSAGQTKKEYKEGKEYKESKEAKPAEIKPEVKPVESKPVEKKADTK